MQTFRFKKNAEIGKLEAETDSFLDACFFESDVYKGIIDFDSSQNNPDFTRRIIVGRTGSGKTALIKQIINSDKIKIHETIEAENTVFEHINNNTFITSLMRNNIDLRVFYKSLWIHILLVKVIQVLHLSGEDSFFELVGNIIKRGKKSYNGELAHEYLEKFKDNFFNDKAITEITKSIESELSGKLNVGILSLSRDNESTEQTRIQSETSSYVSRELLRKQKELIKLLREEFSNDKQVRIVISIDDLDKSWLSSSEIRYDFINALLEAFKELLDIKSVKILISIRTDIIMGIYKGTLRQEEKDESLIYAISWNEKEITEILNKRMNYLVRNQYQSRKEVKFADIFNFHVSGVPAEKFILDRTMLRPRDAINFINLCLAECDGEVALNERIVLEAEENFYASRKKALIKEWISIFPNIGVYLDAITLITNQRFKISDYSDKDSSISQFLMSKYANGPLETTDYVVEFEELVKIWFTVGVVNIVKSSDIFIHSSFQKPELDISDLNKVFIVHPLFYRQV